jgi:cytochrome P450
MYYSTSAYFPFSAGHHSCIGMNFAWQEMRVVAANYLARFDVEEVPKQKLDIRQYITVCGWQLEGDVKAKEAHEGLSDSHLQR